MLVIFGMSRPPPFLKKHQIPKNTLSSKGATTVPSLKHYLGCRKNHPRKERSSKNSPSGSHLYECSILPYVIDNWHRFCSLRTTISSCLCNSDEVRMTKPTFESKIGCAKFVKNTIYLWISNQVFSGSINPIWVGIFENLRSNSPPRRGLFSMRYGIFKSDFLNRMYVIFLILYFFWSWWRWRRR